MIAEKSEGGGVSLLSKRHLNWIRLLLSVLLSLLGLWYIAKDTSLAEIRAAFAQASALYIALGLLVIFITTVAKAWRWQQLYRPDRPLPSFSPVFWSLSLGQLVNTAVPFLRLGELARVYDLGRSTGTSKARALGTLVVEKVLDLITLVLTLFVLLPAFVIPDFIVDSGAVTALIAAAAFAGLFLVAFRIDFTIRLASRVISWLPARLGKRLLPIVTTGLGGLSALRDPGAILILLASSAAIAILSVLTPFVLFRAVGLELPLVAAAALHVAVLVGTLPPSTPAKIGVFEFLVAWMLRFFGVDDAATILAYTIIYHLVVILPQILLGGIAVARGAWNGRR